MVGMCGRGGALTGGGSLTRASCCAGAVSAACAAASCFSGSTSEARAAGPLESDVCALPLAATVAGSGAVVASGREVAALLATVVVAAALDALVGAVVDDEFAGAGACCSVATGEVGVDVVATLVGVAAPKYCCNSGMRSRNAKAPPAMPSNTIAAIAHGSADDRERAGCGFNTASCMPGDCPVAAAANAAGARNGCGVGVVPGSGRCPETGVRCPTIVAAAGDIFVCRVIGPPLATRGWRCRSAHSSWQV